MNTEPLFSIRVACMHREGVPKRCGLSALILLAAGVVSAALPVDTAQTWFSALERQNVSPEAVMGVDSAGVPMLCGGGFGQVASVSEGASASGVLSAGMRSWELIPNVIRNDGIDPLRLEVDVNGPVTKVVWDGFTDYLVSESGTNNLTLRDDGLEGDRVAGDGIFTSERLRYRAEIPMPPYQGNTSNTPPGLAIQWAGQIRVTETNGAVTLFLTPPILSVLSTNVPAVDIVMLASNAQATAHLLNLVTTNRDAQKILRIPIDPRNLSKQIYGVMPDAFDFLSFITTDHVEYTPQLTGANFTSGRHFRVRMNYTGTGANPFDQGSTYGSSNRLLGLNVFDTAGRGTGTSFNAAHEYMHQWASYTSTSLGLSTSDGHYRPAAAHFSLLGGFKLLLYTNGMAFRDCDGEGPGPSEAPPLDKYMMGLVATSAVAPIYLGTNNNVPCYPYPIAITGQVTIAQIVAVHGPRTPDPNTAKRSFAIGFVAGSHQRLLNATEMTYYEIMAEWFTRTVPPSAPNPAMSEGWVPITRFFGEGTTWSSEMLTLIRPKITGIERLTNGAIRVSGTGYPGRNYRLLGTSNLVNWIQVTNTTATANGAVVLSDISQPRPALRYYRASTP
jgi:hypothetical protein